MTKKELRTNQVLYSWHSTDIPVNKIPQLYQLNQGHKVCKPQDWI